MTTSAATFIGHQTWLVEVGNARVLVDPVLTNSFGSSAALRFEIYPGRSVDVDRLPDVNAVIVTSRHLDHFHMPSLRMLAQRAPIVIPALMPVVCVEALESIGARVVLLAPGKHLPVGDAELHFLAGAPTAPVSESRVYSVWVTERHQTTGGVLIQSATDVGAAANSLTPELFVVTHNPQTPPAGHLGIVDNMLPIEPDHRDITVGLQMLRQLLIDSASRVARSQFMLFSGGGYVQNPRTRDPFLRPDYNMLAEVANSLSIDETVIRLAPGERFSGSRQPRRDRVDWITPRELADLPHESGWDADAERDLSEEIEPLFGHAINADDTELIDHELQSMAPHLMLSRLGRSLVDVNDYLGNSVGPHRVGFHLRSSDGDRVMALNFNTAQFDDIDATLRDAVFTMPSGIDVWAADLAAVLRGRIHIWELARSRMRQWYVPEAVNSPIGFLFGYLSEEVRPDLAARLYRHTASC